MELDRPLVSTADVARRFSVSPRTVRRLIVDGHLAAVRIRGQHRVEAAEIERYLADRRERPRGAP